MTTSLTLTSGRRPDGRAQLAVTGEIDMSNIDTFARALDDVVGHLVVDLTEVGYLDSAGLSVLFARADRLELVISPLLEPVLTISGLTDLTTVHTTSPPEAPTGR
ncbi:STAS domain-containing protein [Streptomyces alkaliphilus]|uniref:STAS domain-containing protein n=1 Tax=Streptomyces alkaliphilus TaxID=1472722 RepID=A0A7W3TAW9_9ACTN|nr:STAS domain-containing protein [Streptomyces alkaliphilus]MBB0243180.1 STAS domain-containing protein [Streptomyces alkaliphilus]MQS06224.1 STAS domain-containing protein [Streptomyces alkaliphilus]